LHALALPTVRWVGLTVLFATDLPGAAWRGIHDPKGGGAAEAAALASARQQGNRKVGQDRPPITSG